MVNEEVLRDTIEAIRQIFPVRKILLFGSYARGDAHQHSDLNLCVVVDPDAEQPLEEWPSKSWLYRTAELTQRICTAELAIDPYIFTEGEFDALREREHPLVERILEEGKVVYEQ